MYKLLAEQWETVFANDRLTFIQLTDILFICLAFIHLYIAIHSRVRNSVDRSRYEDNIWILYTIIRLHWSDDSI